MKNFIIGDLRIERKNIKFLDVYGHIVFLSYECFGRTFDLRFEVGENMRDDEYNEISRWKKLHFTK
ncbi:MAG: hypothetical protein KAI43_04140 [Candidatus Aureabacteria bacterium]|nr:hypothetical protein [Candidatus Auribacterota bacterium]